MAAVGDLHLGTDSVGTFAPHLEALHEHADVLLLAGDLTRVGRPEEAVVVGQELNDVTVPVVAVLGNHDHHSGAASTVAEILSDAGVIMLEGQAIEIDIDGVEVGIAGTSGFGGGFAGACGSEFGEREMKDFMAHSRSLADGLHGALASLDASVRIALLHYSPTDLTLAGERLEIYPFLGSYLLAEAIDDVGADLIVHGHAHHGTEKGITPGGTHVRNVAQPVLGQAYAVYCIDPSPTDGRADPELTRATTW